MIEKCTDCKSKNLKAYCSEAKPQMNYLICLSCSNPMIVTLNEYNEYVKFHD